MISDIRLHPEVIKFLAQLPNVKKKNITEKLNDLKKNPKKKKPGLDIKKMKGTKKRQDIYRLRVGDIRIMYSIEDNVIWVTDIFYRGNDYRDY